MTARDIILNRLAHASGPVALHELDLKSVSQTSASARLREMARDGVVKSVRVPGKRFTDWILTPQSDIDWKDPKNARLLIQKLDKEMMLEEAEEEEFEESVKPYWAGEK